MLKYPLSSLGVFYLQENSIFFLHPFSCTDFSMTLSSISSHLHHLFFQTPGSKRLSFRQVYHTWSLASVPSTTLCSSPLRLSHLQARLSRYIPVVGTFGPGMAIAVCPRSKRDIGQRKTRKANSRGRCRRAFCEKM